MLCENQETRGRVRRGLGPYNIVEVDCTVIRTGDQKNIKVNPSLQVVEEIELLSHLIYCSLHASNMASREEQKSTKEEDLEIGSELGIAVSWLEICCNVCGNSYIHMQNEIINPFIK